MLLTIFGLFWIELGRLHERHARAVHIAVAQPRIAKVRQGHRIGRRELRGLLQFLRGMRKVAGRTGDQAKPTIAARGERCLQQLSVRSRGGVGLIGHTQRVGAQQDRIGARAVLFFVRVDMRERGEVKPLRLHTWSINPRYMPGRIRSGIAIGLQLGHRRTFGLRSDAVTHDIFGRTGAEQRQRGQRHGTAHGAAGVLGRERQKSER